MNILIDTSAFYALLNENDRHHKKAEETWDRLLSNDHEFFIHNYIAVETFALVQNRLGMEAVKDVQMGLFAPVDTIWVDQSQHQRALEGLIASENRSVSLVDRVSFVVMRDRHIQQAFCFDSDFEQAGFQCIPEIDCE